MGTDVLIFIALMLLLVSIQKICSAGDSINTTHFLRDGETIVSPGGIFELGFFSPNKSSNHHYIGIWYKQIPVHTVVWVANRDTPITNTSSVVFQIIYPGRLALVDANNSTLWNSSTPTSSVQTPVAKLLDSGNLVITDANNDNNFVWQSFEHPTDTFLPGMILGKNFLTGFETTLTAWISETNPGSGEYKVFLEPTGYPQLVITKGSKKTSRSGPWNGLQFNGLTGLETKGSVAQVSVIVNTTGFFAYFQVPESSMLVRAVLSSSGEVNLYAWGGQRSSEEWDILYTAPTDGCDRYGYCGAYSICYYDNYPICDCFDEFLPRNLEQWGRGEYSGGCVRKTGLSSCHQNGSSSDEFLKYSGIQLPDTKLSWFNTSMNLQECEQFCLNNCSCTAYSTLNISNGQNGCLVWFGDLIDHRLIPQNGQDLFVRIASSDSGVKASVPTSAPTNYASHSKKLKIIILSSSLLIIVLLALSSIMIFIFYKRKGKERESVQPDLKLVEDYILFEASTITRATDNFSLKNKIGEGGYGPVYKGVLDDGKEIAVKMHSKTSTQGLGEFKNEVNFIAKLQHRNLVKLHGWCIKGEEKMLIYEYMPNKSLDSFIFDNTKRRLLDWTKRFDIINGIARGLLYLHQDSRLRIIHRDLKASNILLDLDMNPKISDFGLAKSIGGNETEANASRVAGTHGYMSPEYAGNGMFSIKSDVFSFGVSVLEIVSGKRNREFSHQDHYENLPSYAWKLFRDGRSIELMDEQLVKACNLSQVLRSIHIGLLCVQQHPEDRPTMSSIVQMLSTDANLPVAKEPGFFTGRKIDSQASTNTEIGSINDVTISSFNPR